MIKFYAELVSGIDFPINETLTFSPKTVVTACCYLFLLLQFAHVQSVFPPASSKQLAINYGIIKVPHAVCPHQA